MNHMVLSKCIQKEDQKAYKYSVFFFFFSSLPNDPPCNISLRAHHWIIKKRPHHFFFFLLKLTHKLFKPTLKQNNLTLKFIKPKPNLKMSTQHTEDPIPSKYFHLNTT